jgi:hypothetical protein
MIRAICLVELGPQTIEIAPCSAADPALQPDGTDSAVGIANY